MQCISMEIQVLKIYLMHENWRVITRNTCSVVSACRVPQNWCHSCIIISKFYNCSFFLHYRPHTHSVTLRLIPVAIPAVLPLSPIPIAVQLFKANHTHTHPFNSALSGTTQQETVSGSGISWDICKSAPCYRQITMPAPHRSVFL